MPTGDFNFSGANSLKNIATPIAIGTAKIIAKKVDTTEPYIEGRAPNFSIFGAHFVPVIKSKPKAWIDSIEFWISTVNIQATKKSIVRAISFVELANTLSIILFKLFSPF